MMPCAPAAATFAVAYEELRAWATASATGPARPPGLFVLRRHGLAAWLAAAPSWLPREQATDRTARARPPLPAAGTPDPRAVPILATMVLACWPEEAR
jgi:hypothetical protein